MTVRKINGFAAPYRSKTFRDETDALVERNGVLYIETDVYELGGDVIIPPFRVSQNGMVISKTTQTSIIKPLTIEAPYYITVSAPSPINVDDLVFQFAKAPSDVSENEVILAEYDGTEWRQLPKVSISGIIEDLAKERVQKNQIGPYSGVITSHDAPNFKNSPGLLFDRSGDRIVFEEELVTPVIEQDPNTDWGRVDRIIYRRPTDSENRIGVRKLVVGGSFAMTGPNKTNVTSVTNGAEVSLKSQSIILPDNTLVVFFTEGFGASLAIKFKKYSADRTALLTSGTVVSVSSDEFSVAVDELGNSHITFVSGGNIGLVGVNTSGSIIYGPFAVESLANTSSNPKISIDPEFTKIFIVFEYLFGPSNKQVYLLTRSLAGLPITPAMRLVNTLTNLTSPSIDVSSDLIVHVAYEESGNIKLLTCDDIGQIISAPATLSLNTASTSWGVMSGIAKSPIVKVADNKEVHCLFLQRKNATDYGIAIHSNGSAFMPDLIAPSEAFLVYSFELDSFDNNLHIIASDSSETSYILVKNLAPVMVESLEAQSSQSVSVVKDKAGSLAHSWSRQSPGTFTNTGAPEDVDHIGPASVAGALNTLNLGANQFSVSSSASTTPIKGMQVEIIGSSEGNDGNYIIDSVTLQDIDSIADTYVISLETNFPSDETPAAGVTVQFKNPDGNLTRFAKTVAELNAVRGLRSSTLNSDIILAKISWPGPIILNYIPPGNIGVNSDLYGMYGDVILDWGKTNANEFTMSNGTRIVDLLTSNVYEIDGGSFPMNDGDALYIMLDGATFNVTPQVAPITALPWGLPIQVLGFVANNEFNPHLFSIAGVGQMDYGEEVTMGNDLNIVIRDRLGITSETTFQPYFSTQIINSIDTYPEAISKLDAQIDAMLNSQPAEDEFIVTTSQTVFISSLITWDPDTSVPDILVFVNGQKQKQDLTGGLGKDFRKNSDSTIEFSYPVKNSTVVIWKSIGFGTSGGGSNLSVKNEGSTVDLFTQSIDFKGAGVLAQQVSPGNVEVVVSTGSGGAQTKLVYNNSGAPIPANRALSWQPDGSVILADANIPTESLFAGISQDEIPDQQFGVAVKGGAVPGALIGLGLSPGDIIFIGETPGELTNVAPPLMTDTVFKVGRAEPPDGVFTPDAEDLWIQPQIISAP
jgi:hypothetical protein